VSGQDGLTTHPASPSGRNLDQGLPGSPALDRGDPAFNRRAWDQRGAGFDRVRNGRIDLGVFELQTGAVPPGRRAWLRSLGDINAQRLSGAFRVVPWLKAP